MGPRTRLACLLAFAALTPFVYAGTAHAAVTLYSQPDASGTMTNPQPTFLTASIESASLGTPYLGKGRLYLTFSMQSPPATNQFDQPGWVALGSCPGCQDLQTYYFTDADRTLLSDGVFHTFTVETEATTIGLADGTNQVYITFFNLPQYQHTTHVKSNADATIPYLIIEADDYPPPIVPPTIPPGGATIYTQGDATGEMTNQQPTFQNAFIDSASLGNLPLGQGPLYLIFTIQDPNVGATRGAPGGVCLEPAGTTDCSTRLQTYYFTDADRALLADKAAHTFLVETGTTTSTYADGTRPVAIGFFTLTQLKGQTKVKSNAEGTIPALTIATAPAATSTPEGASSVLFLPGTEASRLYYRDVLGVEHQVWEPSFRTDIPYLAMNADGSSKYALYTKDIIDRMTANSAFEGSITRIFGPNLEVYKGLESYMDTLVEEGTIGEWRAYPYDWRYGVRDVVERGTPTWVPGEGVRQVYLANVLREMASSSASGKVTIVAHSNGGLLAKALASSLGADASRYIDRIVLVGTPQWGTPAAVGAMLHSDNFASMPSLIINSVGARTVMRDMPNPYELLPSATYFSEVADPVATFDPGGALTGPFATAYGESITSSSALKNFLTDSAGLDSTTGSASDIKALIPLSSSLLEEARATQASLEAWEPPPGVRVTAIAGWGQDTVKSLAYTTGSRTVCTRTALIFKTCTSVPKLEHAPLTTQDGDGTVVSPSAIGEMGERLYFNAKEFNKVSNKPMTHQNLTSADPIQSQMRALLKDEELISEFITPLVPAGAENPITRISSHSPVNVVVTDAGGQESGVLPIPGSDFSGAKQDIVGSSVHVFGDEQYVSVPRGGAYEVRVAGYAEGEATLQIESLDTDGSASTTALFAHIPVTASSVVTFSVASGEASSPAVDLNGDGTTDFEAVSTTAVSPVEYVQYIQSVVEVLGLPQGAEQPVLSQLADIEAALAASTDASAAIDALERFVVKRVTGNAQPGIEGPDAELILGMISELKALL